MRRAERNPYREAIEALLRGSNNRLTLLTAGLLSVIMQAQVDAVARDRAERPRLGGDAGLWLARCLGLWPLTNPNPNRCLGLWPLKRADPAIAPAPAPARAADSPSALADAVGSLQLGDGEDEPTPAAATTAGLATREVQLQLAGLLEGEETKDAAEAAPSSPDSPTAAPAPLRQRLRTESMERERGRAKGLADHHKERDDLDDDVAAAESAFITEPDIMNLDKLMGIAEIVLESDAATAAAASDPAPPAANSPTKGKRPADAGLGALTQTLLDALLHQAHCHSLIAVQVLAHTIYSAALLAFASRQPDGSQVAKPAGGHVKSTQAAQADTDRELRLVHQSVAQALHKAAAALLARMPAPSPTSLASPGHGGQFFFVLQEELRRMQGRRWSGAKSGILCNTLLYLPPCAEIVASLGIDYDVPICQAETIRREVQVFLLVKALSECLGRLLGALGSDSGAAPALAPTEDDLFLQSVGSDMAAFTEAGIMDDIRSRAALEPGVTATQFVQRGAVFEMKGKKFLDARIVSAEAAPAAASTTTSRSSFYKRRSSGNSNLDLGNDISPDSSSSPPPSSSSPFSVTSYLFGYRRPSVSAGSPFGKANTRLGSVFFIQHDFLLVLVGPQSPLLSPTLAMTLEEKFEAAVVVPLLYIEAIFDPTDCTRLRVVARSWDPVVNMEQVGHGGGQQENSQGLLSGSTHGLDDGGHTLARAPTTQGHSFLLPRPLSNLWQLLLQFESEQACLLAREHMEARTALLRQEMEVAVQDVIRGFTVGRVHTNEDGMNALYDKCTV